MVANTGGGSRSSRTQLHMRQHAARRPIYGGDGTWSDCRLSDSSCASQDGPFARCPYLVLGGNPLTVPVLDNPVRGAYLGRPARVGARSRDWPALTSARSVAAHGHIRMATVRGVAAVIAVIDQTETGGSGSVLTEVER